MEFTRLAVKRFGALRAIVLPLLATGLMFAATSSNASTPYAYKIDQTSGQMVSLFSDQYTPPASTTMTGSPSGPHLAKVWLYFIFWGSAWMPQNNPSPSPASIVSSDTLLIDSSFLNEMPQYGFQQALIGGYTTDSSNSADGTWNGTQEVENLLQSPGRLPGPPDASWQSVYVIITPNGLSNPFDGDHEEVAIPSGSPATPPVGQTGVTEIIRLYLTGAFSHELVEAISDPSINNQRLNWSNPDPQFPPGDNEIADAGDGLAGLVPNGENCYAYWMNNLRADGVPQGLAPVVSGNSMCSYLNDQSNMPDVFYIGIDGRISELYWTGSAWNSGGLMTQPNTGSAQPALAPTALTCCAFSGGSGDTHVYYFGTDYLIHELYRHAGTWFIGSITSADTNPDYPLAGCRALTSMVSPTDGTIHVYYMVPAASQYTSAQLWELYNPGPGGGWAQRAVGTLDSPSNTTQLAGVVDGSGIEHLFFIASNGDVEETYWNGQQWNGIDWTRYSGDVNLPGTEFVPNVPPQDDVACYYDGSAIHVFYSGNDLQVHDISRNGGVNGQYYHYNVSTSSGDPNTAGAELTCYFDGTLGHVANIALTGDVHEFSVQAGLFGGQYAEQWNPYVDLTSTNGVSASFQSRSLTSVYDSPDQAAYIFYPSNDRDEPASGDIGTFYTAPSTGNQWLSAILPYSGFYPGPAP